MHSTVFWSATAHQKSLEDRLLAAQAGGFDELSVFPTDVVDIRTSERTVDDLLASAASLDVSLSILDPFAQWLPENPAVDTDFDHGEWFAFDEHSFFELGTAIQPDSITVVERFSDALDIEVAAECFGRVCDRAATHGWQVHLEFMPFTEISDLETAWEIVRRADRPNGGIVFDTLHYYRGTPDDQLLREIPGEKIFRVQVCDAGPFEGSLREEAIRGRRFPGEGTLDLVHVLGILEDIGGLNSVGIEVFSEELAGKPAREIGERAGNSLRDVLSNV